MVCNVSYGFYEEGLEKGLEKGREEGRVEMLIGLVKDGLLSLKNAAARVNMKESDFSALMAATK